MGTVLVYRNTGHEPYCEVALDNGDTVLVRLDERGATIERQAKNAGPSERLFQASPDVVTDLCLLLIGNAAAPKSTPLDLLVSIVSQMRSADDVRVAFKQASAAI